MITGTIIGFDGALASAITGLTLLADGSWREVKPFGVDDLVIIPTIGAPIDQTLAGNSELIRWLRQFQDAGDGGVRVASNCTGAFLLAAAGLLDGRKATTHWGFSNPFRERFPAVDLQPEKLVTVDGPVACAGGGMAWWDLGVYLVERFAGPQVARELAKAFVIDAGRTSQAPYSALQARRYHSDGPILQLQDWLDAHYHQPVTLPSLATLSGLTERSLIRRFKEAGGGGGDHPAGRVRRRQLVQPSVPETHRHGTGRLSVEIRTLISAWPLSGAGYAAN